MVIVLLVIDKYIFPRCAYHMDFLCFPYATNCHS